MMKAGFDQEVNAKKAEAELAYTLQAAKEKQAIREQQIEVYGAMMNATCLFYSILLFYEVFNP